METIINKMTSEVEIIKKTIKALEDAKLKSFWPKTLENFNEKYNLVTYAKKHDMDVLNEFHIRYDYFDALEKRDASDWTSTISTRTPEEALKNLKEILPYKEKQLEKAKMTIKKENEILEKMIKIDKLLTNIDYENFDSSITKKIYDKNYRKFNKLHKLFK